MLSAHKPHWCHRRQAEHAAVPRPSRDKPALPLQHVQLQPPGLHGCRVVVRQGQAAIPRPRTRFVASRRSQACRACAGRCVDCRLPAMMREVSPPLSAPLCSAIAPECPFAARHLVSFSRSQHTMGMQDWIFATIGDLHVVGRISEIVQLQLVSDGHVISVVSV